MRKKDSGESEPLFFKREFKLFLNFVERYDFYSER